MDTYVMKILLRYVSYNGHMCILVEIPLTNYRWDKISLADVISLLPAFSSALYLLWPLVNDLKAALNIYFGNIHGLSASDNTNQWRHHQRQIWLDICDAIFLKVSRSLQCGIDIALNTLLDIWNDPSVAYFNYFTVWWNAWAYSFGVYDGSLGNPCSDPK